MDEYAKNITKVEFTQGKKTSSKKAFMDRKLSGTANWSKDVFQGNSKDESDIFLKIFVPTERT